MSLAPRTCQRPVIPGLRCEPAARPALDKLVLVEDQWAGPHERHLPHEDIEQLWKLVEPPAPEEVADPGHARVVRDLEHPRIVGEVHVQVSDLGLQALGVLDHRPELEDTEGPLALAHSHLSEEDRAHESRA